MAKYLRPLDPLERLHLALYNTKVYNNVQVGLVYSCSPFKPPHRPDYPQKHTPMAPSPRWPAGLACPTTPAARRRGLHSLRHTHILVTFGRSRKLVHYETIQHVTEMKTVIEAKHTLSFDVAKQDMPFWCLFVVQQRSYNNNS
ncbi:hypothetical protein MVEG_11975 [Podila verticillata NRRL 6337]|uniref:Uncharacterized protein n=1 Tax=Podila verticillata NRRL 6337 TaxID=1069443 RepID=A0A086TKV5_9FUNG|nr:hypothetical protein MVEG_11975 [Podila verticillata NRRL 6337]